MSFAPNLHHQHATADEKRANDEDRQEQDGEPFQREQPRGCGPSIKVEIGSRVLPGGYSNTGGRSA
jgi:hypothetical protein